MSDKHPIEGIMSTALQNIKEMIDVNTIIGEPVNCADGTVIIPVSRVSFGFGAGGGEYGKPEAKSDVFRADFGGGSGAGVSINPVGFLVVNNGDVKLLTLSDTQSSVSKIIDSIPETVNSIKNIFNKKEQDSETTVNIEEN